MTKMHLCTQKHCCCQGFQQPQQPITVKHSPKAAGQSLRVLCNIVCINLCCCAYLHAPSIAPYATPLWCGRGWPSLSFSLNGNEQTAMPAAVTMHTQRTAFRHNLTPIRTCHQQCTEAAAPPQALQQVAE
jgi:hypothetical protein